MKVECINLDDSINVVVGENNDVVISVDRLEDGSVIVTVDNNALSEKNVLRLGYRQPPVMHYCVECGEEVVKVESTGVMLHADPALDLLHVAIPDVDISF